MTMLVTLAEVKAYLRIDTADSDAEITLLTEAASEGVLRYIKAATEDDIPVDGVDSVKAATLLQVGNLFRFKGDEENPETVLSPTVRAVLHSLRDPTLA